MCGIAGYLNTRGERPPDLAAMTALLTHRGPDDAGIFEEPGIGLGHRRLSIIDLSPSGHQPMVSPDRTLVITYNGEIYNYIELREELRQHGHVFVSTSDTEVILAAYRQWGEDCVRHFNGMWAFAIWDRRARTLFCSRDRFGVKPFYYLEKAGIFAFASEPKALLAAFPEERRPDWDTLYSFLSQAMIMERERTFYAAIRLLLPGHNLLVRDGSLRSSRYWSYPAADAKAVEAPSAEHALRFRELFIDAVRLRARADVDVGTTLSGGLDSTAIVAAYRLLHPDASHKSYSAIFDGKAYDESDYIDAVVGHYHLQAHKIPQDAGNLLADMRELVWKLDSPLISPAIIPLHRVLRRVRADGTKVLYDGQGADELLAGYDNQFYPPYLHTLLQAPLGAGGWPERIGMVSQAVAGMTRPRALWTARYTMPWLTPLYRRAIAAGGVLSREFRGRVAEPAPLPRRYDEPLNEALYQAHAHSILPGLLHYGDGVSMANSIEYRLPFMDYRLVEYAFALSASDKMGKGFTKLILREALDGVMIDKVRLRRWKNGFHTPILSWILASPDLLDATVHSPRMREHGVLDQGAVRAAMAKHGGGALAQHLLRWLSTELWMQQCIDTPAGAQAMSSAPTDVAPAA
jgi:asparagine synthase (glutamine-hydrolysing)